MNPFKLKRRPFADRLVLGTAQFGLAYGLNNVAGQPSVEAVDELLTAAVLNDLRQFDTATAYGDAETRLGSFFQRQPHLEARIVTKIAAADYATTWQHLRASLERLRQLHVYGVLFHDFASTQQHPAAWDALREAHAQGVVERLGVSLYHPWQAEQLLAGDWPVTLVQLPYNVLDQRFAPWLGPLADAGVEVHLRSAFLQGLLLRDPTTLPAFFQPLAPKLTRLRQLADAAQVPVPALLLLFNLLAHPAAKAVIGVDSLANLLENMEARAYWPQAQVLHPELQQLAESDDTFILPYTWPKS